MYDSYIYANGGDVTLTLTNIPPDSYDFFCYGHGAADEQNSTFTLAGQKKSTGVGPFWSNNQLAAGGWTEDKHFVVFRNVQVQADVPFIVTVGGGSGGYAILNGLQMRPAALTILKQPTDQHVPEGGTARFEVTARSSLTNQIGYQWFFFDHAIVGATNAQFTIPSVSSFYVGRSSVQVLNSLETIMQVWHRDKGGLDG